MIEESILTAISTVGFPIVAFFTMVYTANITISANTKALADLKIALEKK